MKAILFLISFFGLINSFGQVDSIKHNRTIKIVTCSPGLNYYYANGKIELLDKGDSNNIIFTKSIDEKSILNINEILDTLTHFDNKLMYWNDCIDDGFCFVMFIRDGFNLQKIYVSNYYVEIIDRLANIFDEQLKDCEDGFDNEIGFGNNKADIDETIKSQNSCKGLDEKWRTTVFDSWNESD